MDIKVGDKIKQIHEIYGFEPLGELFIVTEIIPKSDRYIMILINASDIDKYDPRAWSDFGYVKDNREKYMFQFRKNTFNDEFYKYFEKIKPKIKEPYWTEWQKTKDGFEYRTDNIKYVELRKNNKYAMASCNLEYDTFSLARGFKICLDKLKDKRDESTSQDEFRGHKLMNSNDNKVTVCDTSIIDCYKKILEDNGYYVIPMGTSKNDKCTEKLCNIIANLQGKINGFKFDINHDYDTSSFPPKYLGSSHYTIKFTVEE